MTQTEIKLIRSLNQQKYRKAHNAYLVEGTKNAKEWLASEAEIQFLVCTSNWAEANQALIDQRRSQIEIRIVEEKTLKKLTALKQPSEVLLVVGIPNQKELNDQVTSWQIYLEELRDPGNLGTIIRIADWFGVEELLLSEQCVEVYNPKVVQASMGSLLRVRLTKINQERLIDYLKQSKRLLYATSLKGELLRTQKARPFEPGIIAMGNESRGLSDTLMKQANHCLKIPGYGKAESLNVAVATGIICSHLIPQ